MIPVDSEWESSGGAIPAEATFWVPRVDELDEVDEGFGAFRGTWVIDTVPFEYATEICEREATLAALADSLARSETEFEAIACAIEHADLAELDGHPSLEKCAPALAPYVTDDYLALEGLELGVAGLVFALSACGCFPAASCRSHRGRHSWSPHPVVEFATDHRHAMTLEPAAQATGCGFDIDPARPELLCVGGPSITQTMALAKQILTHADQFATLPTAIGRDRDPGSQGTRAIPGQESFGF